MTVTNNVNNITNAEPVDSASWDDLGGGQGSGQSADSFVEGTESRGRKVSNAILGFSHDNGSAHANIGNTGMHIGLWYNVLQASALNEIVFSFSDSASGAQSGNWDGHLFSGTNYPNSGGFKRLWIDVARTRESGSGTLTKSNIQNVGARYNMQSISGNAYNCYLDGLSYSANGLLINGGSSGTPTKFADAIAVDITNSLGLIDADFISGTIQIGGGATYFEDGNFAFKAGVQPLAASDWIKIEIINDTVGMTIQLGSYFLDSIPFVITGTSSSIGLGTGTLLNAPAMTWNSSVTFNGSLVACDTLTQNGATITGATIAESIGAVAALIVDDLAKVTKCSFIGTGTGHAVDLGNFAADETVVWDNIVDLTTYALDAGTDANKVIHVDVDSGFTLTISVAGTGSTPTVYNSGLGSVDVQSGLITISVKVTDEDTGLILENAHVYLEKVSDQSVLLSHATDDEGIVEAYIPFDVDTNLVGWARLVDLVGTDYDTKEFTGSYDSGGGSITVTLKPTEV